MTDSNKQALHLYPVHLKHPPHTFQYYELCTPEGEVVKIPERIKTVEEISTIAKLLNLNLESRVIERDPAEEHRQERIAEINKELAELLERKDELGLEKDKIFEEER